MVDSVPITAIDADEAQARAGSPLIADHHASPDITGLSAMRTIADFTVDPITLLERQYARSGPITRVRLALPWLKEPRTVVLLVGPSWNRDVLMATDRLRPTGIWPVKAPPGSAQANLRSTYLTTHGREHKNFSEAVAPHLDRSAVARHFGRARRIALAEVSRWPVGSSADIHALTRKLSQHYAFDLLLAEADAVRIDQFGKLLESHHSANWSLAVQMLPWNLPFTPYGRMRRGAEALQSEALKWVAGAAGCPAHGAVRGALCDVRDNDGARLPAKRVAAHLSGFALASFETTATTLTWALVLLAAHQEAQDKLVAELAEIDCIDAVEAEQLVAMPWLNAVINETLRLVTPVPMLGFKTLAATEIGGISLPHNATVVISPHLTHRMPELYANPRRFLPERWDTIRPSTYEFLPFSGGQRRCPGFLFAMSNLRLALTVIMSRCRVALAPGVRIDRHYSAITGPRRRAVLQLLPPGHRSARASQRGSLFDLFDAP